MMKRFLLTILLIGLVALVGRADIGVGPLTLIIEAPPGGSGSGYFKVVNDGEAPEEVTVSLADWDLDRDGGIRFLEPGTLERSLAPWVEYSPATFKLKPGEVQKVEFSFTVPEGATGDHWALFFVEGSQVTPVAETTGALQTSVGVKVRYGVKVFQHDPNAQRQGRITGMELLNASPLKLKLVFANTGDGVLFRVTGRVEIRDVTGATVRTLPIEEFTVLPGGERELTVEDQEELSPGDYIALAIIDFGGDYLVGHQLQFRV